MWSEDTKVMLSSNLYINFQKVAAAILWKYFAKIISVMLCFNNFRISFIRWKATEEKKPGHNQNKIKISADCL